MNVIDDRRAVAQRGEQLRHHEIVQFSDAELAAHIRTGLGAKLAAYLGNVKETRAVRQWADGERSIRDPRVVQRYRVAAVVLGIVRTRAQADVAQAWFQGLNPILDDRSPLVVLKGSGGDDDAAREALAAARAFAAD